MTHAVTVRRPAGTPRVADAMIRSPKTCPPGTTVSRARELLANDHVHALLIVAGDRLLGVVERGDLHHRSRPGDRPVTGTLRGRTVAPEADLHRVHAEMVAAGRRRLAVVTTEGLLLGLLCLKRSHAGFCSDAGVLARAADRARFGSRAARG